VTDHHLTTESGWTPLRNLVVVREEPPEEERESGLQIVRLEDPRGNLVFGEVVLTGPDCQEVEPGDRVIYNRWHGVEVWVGEREPGLALKEHEIVAKEVA
jgi:co-chaperonin GroES (HSP10)